MTQSDFLAALMQTLYKEGPLPTPVLPVLIAASGINPNDAILALAKGETVGLIAPVDAAGLPCLPVMSVNIVLTDYGTSMVEKHNKPNPYDACGDQFLTGWDETNNN